MTVLRNSVGAFLQNEDKVLLLKRSEHKKIAPSVWSGVGGHMEKDEINDPLSACYREILEETGIAKEEIYDLKLKYVIIRYRFTDNEIRQSYVYFGKTSKKETIQTDEGVLHWISKEEMLNRTFSDTFAEMLKHHSTQQNGSDDRFVGVAENKNGALNMNWALLKDFE